jgi:hypothetical protein
MIAITYSMHDRNRTLDGEGAIYANGRRIARSMSDEVRYPSWSADISELVRRANATPIFLEVLQWFKHQIDEGMEDAPRELIQEMTRRTLGAIAAAELLKLTRDELHESNVELLTALEALTDWGREHTSPLQPNSPHELLVRAAAAVAKAKGGQS